VLQIYEPQPDPRLVALYGEHGAFVPVHDHSPRWLRNRLAGMATIATALRVSIAKATAMLKHRCHDVAINCRRCSRCPCAEVEAEGAHAFKSRGSDHRLRGLRLPLHWPHLPNLSQASGHKPGLPAATVWGSPRQRSSRTRSR
jgi:hypothetical protein